MLMVTAIFDRQKNRLHLLIRWTTNIVGLRDIMLQSRHIVGICITLHNFTIILTAFLLLTQQIY